MNAPYKNALEWVVFGLSLVLVLGVIGYLAYSAITEETTPPEFDVEVGEPRRQGERYLLPVTVHNRGGTTAASVVVEVASASERAEVTFAFLPRKSSRKGAVLFERPPGSDSLRARVVGYEEP